MPSPANLPERAGDTTAEQPWPVRLLSMKIAEYVDRMSPLWVEGQIVQLNRRPGAPTAFVTLRDTDVDMSLTVTVRTTTLDAMGAAVQQGARVVAHAKPTFWTKRGSLQLEARSMRPVGEGELLLRIEQLKRTLAAEGLFDAQRKKPLPFLPRTVGLIVGRASAAEKDVVENARRRWPAVSFEIRQVAVQGPDTVPGVSAALKELDALEQVDVIIIARGGGSFEDLLPFSNDSLVRAVSQAQTPVVSAIGHDIDTPMLDLVADVRASTPTDAAKLVAPDLVGEERTLAQHRERLMQGLRGRFSAERRHLNALRSRPALADPQVMVRLRRDDLARLTERSDYSAQQRISRAADQINHARSQVIALSPHQTLARGYAVVQQRDGELVTSRDQVSPDDLLKVTVSDGNFAVTPVSAPASAPEPKPRKAATPQRTAKKTATKKAAPKSATKPSQETQEKNV